MDDAAFSRYCPICGRDKRAVRRVGPHRCAPKTLAAIDAAHRSSDLEPGDMRDYRTYGGRLSEGFRDECDPAVSEWEDDRLPPGWSLL